ncbi:MAG: enoyl-CoA hydratase [Deltaproteobacteria bacterium]|nr:enoyl-CoA hydratase [Deltaproteobacteria bacterium]
MAYRTVLYEEKNRIGRITLNRPEKRNALSLELLEEMRACLRGAGKDRSAKVLIVNAAGEHFSAGHDLNEVRDGDLGDIRHLFQTCLELMMEIQRVPQPVIAEVRGIATAAGCQLVAACDLAVAGENARFATPGVRIGLFCTTPMVPLSRNVGRKRALEMLLTGRFVSAREALDFGLVNRVVPDDRLEEETGELASELARYSAETLGIGKQAFYTQIHMDDERAYRYGREVIAANAVTPDAREGISAFLEKRLPVWKEDK